ncbi:MAG: VCBS repeat-containing protein [Planctomycetes bacterium]|nr:VCBS repeat-containing protein [Planctomycetota bacterium]
MISLPRLFSRTLLAAGSALLLATTIPAQQNELEKLVAADNAPGDKLGWSVAIDGDTALVGASDKIAGGFAQAGAVYVYTRTGGVWSEQQKLEATFPQAQAFFGFSVALSGDTAVIGARNEGSGAGAAYVFTRMGGVWSEQDRLLPSDTRANLYFGHEVAIDGDTLAVGALGWLNAAGQALGAAYFFERVGGVWTEQQFLTGDPIGGDETYGFGSSISLDGDTAAVGAPTSHPGGQYRAGVVRVLLRTSGTWAVHQVLTQVAPQANSFFGFDVALHGDRLAIGASTEDESGVTDVGALYVFERSAGSFGGPQRLVASDPSTGANLGYGLGLRGDTLVAGAPYANGLRGAGYVFRELSGSWSETTRLLASDGGANDAFGFSVGYDGATAFVGSYGDDHGPGGSGSAYVFEVASSGGGPNGPTAPRDVALGDANGDGDLDALTANSASHDLGLWLGDGTGALAAPVSVALTASDLAPVAVAFGDLDGDGSADDAAVACSDSHTVGIVLNVGGSSSASSRTTGGLRPSDVVCGDLDGSGTDDVVVARQGEPLSGGSGLSVSLNGGAFSELSIPSGHARQVVKLALGDLGGDSDLDLAVVAQGAPDQLLLFAGDGAGALSFAGAISLSSSGLASGLCLGDLDGDGMNDLAVLLSTLFPTPTSSLEVHRYTGSGALDASDFTADTALPTTGTLAHDVACGELDGDSYPGVLHRPELVVVHAGSGDVQAFYGYVSATSSATSTSALSAGSNPIAIAIGDLNGDGSGDVVIANQGSDDLSVHLGELLAQSLAFGTGCAGTGGLVPLLAGTGLPTLGNAAFGLHLSQARAVAPFLVLLSATTSEIAVGSCTLYLGAPLISILRFTNGSGENDYVFGVPNDPLLLGATVFFQDAVFDPAGAYASTLALSNALRVRVGN